MLSVTRGKQVMRLNLSEVYTPRTFYGGQANFSRKLFPFNMTIFKHSWILFEFHKTKFSFHNVTINLLSQKNVTISVYAFNNKDLKDKIIKYNNISLLQEADSYVIKEKRTSCLSTRFNETYNRGEKIYVLVYFELSNSNESGCITINNIEFF